MASQWNTKTSKNRSKIRWPFKHLCALYDNGIKWQNNFVNTTNFPGGKYSFLKLILVIAGCC
jgi:hypothetical protein